MLDRLVLGSSSLVQTVAEELEGKPGTVRVGTSDRSLATTLRETGVEAETLDPTDETTLAGLDPDIVVVLQDTKEAGHAATRAARNALPDAYLLVYAGDDGPSQDTALEAIADEVIDRGRAAATRLVDHVGDNGRQFQQLRHVLLEIDRLAVVAHDNPDPDAIASGVALGEIATDIGCETEICYHGDISHQENRAFVNLLGLDLRRIEADTALSGFDGIALVDHSRPGVNDQLAPDTDIDIVIDHHPPRSPVDAQFVDLRSCVGATSTLLVEYLDRSGVPVGESLATALLFGIQVDTRSFSREVSNEDFEAAATLLSAADLEALERIESPSVDAQTLETIASAIRHRRVEDGVLLSFVGSLSSRDTLSQAADLLLTPEGVTTTLVYGVMDGTVYASARSSDPQLDIGQTLRGVFDHLGSAGGHADMAGAQFGLGVFGDVDGDESLREVLESSVTGPFLEAAEASARPERGDLDTADASMTGRYLVTPASSDSSESATDDGDRGESSESPDETE
jgi:nanoRNase/pAp phosphatase (c-di-AMP/oligoRNAs hydrolase)